MASLDMLTLNVGGRNDNLFEFTVTDDGTPMGHELADRLETAENVLNSHGPLEVKGYLEEGIARIFGDATVPSWVMGLLDASSWLAAQKDLLKNFNKDWMSAIDIMTQTAGRPAPLVGYDFITELDTSTTISVAEYTQLWYAWLVTLNREEKKLIKRVKAKNMDLNTALAGLFFYDTMIISCITESNQAIADIMSLSQKLPFSTVEGKHVEVVKHIREHDYPAMVALQEGKGFDAVYLTSELKDCYWLTWGKITDGAGAAETGLLLSKGLFAEPTAVEITEAVLSHRPENDPETKAWDTTSSKILMCKTEMRGYGPVVIGSVHCKDSPKTFDILVAMKACMVEACPEALFYVLGMDSNSKETDFAQRLQSVFPKTTERLVGGAEAG
eukprot:CAMPEP_0119499432 /NCGR_PEP_ID=MMETSP1344-20130328/21889_1 /TAXON_ID=236787 /ORGANISM="Florenciella parvula, Strain CCMP2471" /LENGTH=385 /DNA_ID=CAMNT_0007535427 /DNA_START=187 /DNA_END=1340 /DNA_ORIENTATION=+